MGVHRAWVHRLVIKALEANWPLFQSKDVTDLGVLIDWCGLYQVCTSLLLCVAACGEFQPLLQAPRTDDQQSVFASALKAINQVRRFAQWLLCAVPVC